MPHKHKRKRGDEADYELPPSQRARPLPVAPSARKESQTPATSKKRNKRQSNGNDAPRAFRRIMAVASGKKFRSGLDDGTDHSKPKTTTSAAAVEVPKIRPGEDMRSYAARVDAALPVSGLTRKTVIKDGKDELGIKVQKTRKERKMHKLYDQWRAEEAKIVDQREEEAEMKAQQELEDDAAGVSTTNYFDDGEKTSGKGKGKGKKKSKRGGADDDDPWAQLKRTRGEARVGLHDVAQAPPQLHKEKTRQLKVRGVGGAAVDVANIPKAAGSLRRREELQAARDDVVEAYRKIKEHEQAKLDAKKGKA